MNDGVTLPDIFQRVRDSLRRTPHAIPEAASPSETNDIRRSSRPNLIPRDPLFYAEYENVEGMEAESGLAVGV
jgi:hypothetical protein